MCQQYLTPKQTLIQQYSHTPPVMKRMHAEAFEDHQAGSNKRVRTEQTAHAWLRNIAMGSK